MSVTLFVGKPEGLQRTPMLDAAGLVIRNWMVWLNTVWQLLTYLRVGSGAPENVVTGTPGMLFLRTDGGAGTTLYVKESGSGNTGWVAK